mgnify:CR=1 FL=1
MSGFWFGVWRDIDREMRELRRRLRRVFEEASRALERGLGPIEIRIGLEDFMRPLIDVYETPEEVVVVAELPGVKKEDIAISVVDSELEIRAEVKREEEVKEEAYFRRERYYKGFYRRIRLPTAVQAEKAKAKYENGVLTIRLPKAAIEKRRRIEIE